MMTATAPAYAKKPSRVSEAPTTNRTTLWAGGSMRACRSGSGPSSFDCELAIICDPLPPATVTRSEETLQIVLPLCGVDLSHVYVIATSRAVVIELRTKRSLDHAGLGVTEIQEERIIRELKLPLEIKEGCTTVRTLGDDLEITCVKAD